jgi:hypothetical protein
MNLRLHSRPSGLRASRWAPLLEVYMDREVLLRIISESLNPTSTHYIKAREEANNLPIDQSNYYFLHNVSKPIDEYLSQQDIFQKGGYMIQQDNWSNGFHSNNASRVIAKRVLEGESPEQAINWLAKILSLKQGSGKGIMAIRGINVTEPIEFGKGVVLLPFSLIPDSPRKEWFMKLPSMINFGIIPNISLLTTPKAALICSTTIEPVIYPAKSKSKHIADPLRNQLLLNDVRLALSLIGPSCPISAGYWFQFDDRDLSDAVSDCITNSYQELLPWNYQNDVEICREDVERIVPKYLQTNDPLKTRIHLSLQRLNQGLNRPPHGDRALDIAIAIESLLVEGIGENTYKMGLRSALLLGGSIEERRRIRSIITALYSLRSSLIHCGILPKEVNTILGKNKSASIVIDATNICAKIIQKIIQLGSIPNWYDYELLSEGS